MKICKTHYKHATTTTMIYTMIYDIFKHAPVFLSPYYPSLHLLCYSGYPSVTPRKKNNIFLSTSHSVYPFQKSVVLYYVTTV
jgi:hypothetical protein